MRCSCNQFSYPKPQTGKDDARTRVRRRSASRAEGRGCKPREERSSATTGTGQLGPRGSRACPGACQWKSEPHLAIQGHWGAGSLHGAWKLSVPRDCLPPGVRVPGNAPSHGTFQLEETSAIVEIIQGNSSGLQTSKLRLRDREGPTRPWS